MKSLKAVLAILVGLQAVYWLVKVFYQLLKAVGDAKGAWQTLMDNLPLFHTISDASMAVPMLMFCVSAILCLMVFDWSPERLESMGNAWRRLRAFRAASKVEGPAQQAPILTGRHRDTWFQHAIFYVAYGYWPPDLSRPLFDPPPAQVPNGEYGKANGAIQKMHQAALDGDLSVWGKRISANGVPYSGPFFKVPKDHWEQHAVTYTEILRSDPSLLRTSKNHKNSSDAWCALMVGRTQVEGLWPSVQPENPLQILTGSGEPFSHLEVNDYGEHRSISVLVCNNGNDAMPMVRLYRKYISFGFQRNKETLLDNSFYLGPRQRRPVTIALYNETKKLPDAQHLIVLAELLGNGWDVQPLRLPPNDDYTMALEAISSDGRIAKSSVRIWVDEQNILRLENLSEPERQA